MPLGAGTYDVLARLAMAVALLPFLVFAGRDLRLHLTVRRVSWAEEALHLFFGLVLAYAISRAFLFEGRALALSLLAFALGGAIDEFGFHRGLPPEEHDAHAKEHFALFLFMAVAGVALHLRPVP
jgi:Kef-type K+ transport system membrane component KefB